MKKGIAVLTVVLGVVVMPVVSLAEIQVDEFANGSALIVSPDGQINVFEAGDPVPVIITGSTLELFEGEATVSTETGDELMVSCLDKKVKIEDLARLKFVIENDACTIITLAGSATNLADDVSSVPTAGGDGDLPGDPISDPDDPDSRSIISSPEG